MREYTTSKSKALGEGMMTLRAIDYIEEHHITFDSFIKISGRYWLNDQFNYYPDKPIVVKYLSIYDVFTALYKIPYYLISPYKHYLLASRSQMNACVSYEALFGGFLRTIERTVGIHRVNTIGLEGYVAVERTNQPLNW
jgi:hypothetical protein